MASVGERRKGARNDLLGRTSREEGLLREVRRQLSRDRDLTSRLRRLERMEQTARLWVNGQELGGGRYAYLSDVHD
jgi:hypothetical protein